MLILRNLVKLIKLTYNLSILIIGKIFLITMFNLKIMHLENYFIYTF